MAALIIVLMLPSLFKSICQIDLKAKQTTLKIIIFTHRIGIGQ